MRIRAGFFAVLTAMICTAAVGAVTLEQVQPVMPQIDVYVRDGSTDLSALTPEAVTASLDDAPLEVEVLEPSEQGIFYVFLVDISRSISEQHLAAARQAVRSVYQQMGQEDQLALISFGNEVNILLRGGESPAQVDAALETIRSTDENTCFYDAMNTLVETASARMDLRRVAVVVSDGVDDTDAGMTREQLVDILRQSGVAVYAMAVDSTGEETQARFRAFIQESGGDLVTFSPENAGAKLEELQTAIDEIWHLRLRAPDNRADGSQRHLSLQFGPQERLEVDIVPTRWIPDVTPPYLLSAQPDAAAGTVTVLFSEPVTGLEDPAACLLRDSAGAVMDTTVTAIADDRAELYCAVLTDPAGWTLEVQGLTDTSMERNAMAACTLLLAPVREEPPQPEEPTFLSLLEEVPYPMLTGIVAGVLVVLLLLLLAVVRHNRKKAYVPKREIKKERRREGRKEAEIRQEIKQEPPEAAKPEAAQEPPERSEKAPQREPTQNPGKEPKKEPKPTKRKKPKKGGVTFYFEGEDHESF